MLTDHSKILTDDKVKDFVAINFMNILNLQEKNKIIIKIAKLLRIFLTTPDEVEQYVQSNSDNCAHHYNVENVDP